MYSRSPFSPMKISLIWLFLLSQRWRGHAQNSSIFSPLITYLKELNFIHHFILHLLIWAFWAAYYLMPLYLAHSWQWVNANNFEKVHKNKNKNAISLTAEKTWYLYFLRMDSLTNESLRLRIPSVSSAYINTMYYFYE